MISVVRFVSTAAVSFALVTGAVLAAQSRTVTLAGEYDSGIHGTATMTDQGRDLLVAIKLTGRLGPNPCVAHIHGGACDQPHARTAYLLEPVIDGKSTTTLRNVSIATLTNANHSIGIHSKIANVTRHLACGALGPAG